ncbi:MAG: 4-(cytidine 5'-diphospho)-2-C-methyl-D-erythritol kinase [Hyphomicrobiales bacterium]|nr:MAG: 4-(cytidine 5'-diphospho)-2-C-methyl-D-erythritol kinase [Hyphomicrobiales bacterium]
MKIFCRAPAKINLTLHITGQRDDGYHLLDTLVIFTELGDELLLSTPDDLIKDRLEISGPFSNDLSNHGENLVLRAVTLLRGILVSQNITAPAVHIELQKNLPVSSGIGGGSADAAATLRGLKKFWDFHDSDVVFDVAKRLGADVPMCLHSNTLRARGVGDEISVLDGFKDFHLLLVNPGVSIATMDIFNALSNKNNMGMEFSHFPAIEMLSDTRNDLQQPAISHAPVIQSVLDALAELPQIQFVRMSGSGATCFGVFETAKDAKSAQIALSSQHPEWWIMSTKLINDKEELDRVIQ